MSGTIQGLRLSHVSMTPNPVDAGSAVLVRVVAVVATCFYATLSASSWTGTGPYTQTLAVDGSVTTTSECTVYVDHTATLDQRMAEFSGLLRAEVVSDGRVLVTALGTEPAEDIPVRIMVGPFPLSQAVDVPASSWSGSGPWTATATVGSSVTSALVGSVSGSEDSDAEAVQSIGLHVSAVSGTTVTLRATLAQPTEALTVGILGVRRCSPR